MWFPSDSRLHCIWSLDNVVQIRSCPNCLCWFLGNRRKALAAFAKWSVEQDRQRSCKLLDDVIGKSSHGWAVTLLQLTWRTPNELSWPGVTKTPSSCGKGIRSWLWTTTRAPAASFTVSMYSSCCTFRISFRPMDSNNDNNTLYTTTVSLFDLSSWQLHFSFCVHVNDDAF